MRTSSVTDEQVAQVAQFTAASPDVCRRVITDFRGNLQAASESLLLSGGREIMCCTLPETALPGQALRISTPRGMVEVTIPDGLRGGDTLTFNLPIPAAQPAVIAARPVAHSPASTPSPDLSFSASELPQAVAMPPTTPSHATIVLQQGCAYPLARPYYGYRGYHHPYYYYDPFSPLLLSPLLLWPFFVSPFLW